MFRLLLVAVVSVVAFSGFVSINAPAESLTPPVANALETSRSNPLLMAASYSPAFRPLFVAMASHQKIANACYPNGSPCTDPARKNASNYCGTVCCSGKWHECDGLACICGPGD